MPVKPRQIVWDACVVIDAIQKTPGRFDLIAPFIADAERGKLLIVLSESTVAEIVHLPRLDGGSATLDQQAEKIKQWLKNPYIVRRPVHPGISELAVDIGRKYGIKRATDSIVIATAIFDSIDTVHTFDGSGGKPGLIQLDGRIGTPPLRICVPNPAEGTIWNRNEDTKEKHGPTRPETGNAQDQGQLGGGGQEGTEQT
jgi:predicted nucleic acid-binding protein